jgi:hypothetical protein
MNDEHEDEGDESLDENALAGRELRCDAGDPQSTDKVVWRRCLSRGRGKESVLLTNQSHELPRLSQAFVLLRVIFVRAAHCAAINLSHLIYETIFPWRAREVASPA